MFMSEIVDREHPSTSPFAGLRPSRPSTLNDSGRSAVGGARHIAVREAARPNRTLMATMPVILVGSLAISSLGLAPAPVHTRVDHRHKIDAVDPELAVSTSPASASDASLPGEVDTAAVAPASYTVRAGDTVSAIAGRYGLSTASVLALNGLGWKTLIFPGQVLRLTKVVAPATPAPPTSTAPIEPVSTVSGSTDSHSTTGTFATTPAPISSTPAPTTPAAPPIPAAPPAATSTNGSYVIQRGDTITAIARKFGLSISSVLAANGLTASSIIYAGRTLVIPGLQIALVGSVTVPLSASMQANAQTIISVGRSLGVPDYGIVVALAAAAQESDLQNVSYGDRDSVGLFQQRPSSGWGTVAQLETPSYAARLFFGGPSNPNKGRTRGLLDIAGWQSMTLTQAAQAVQISGSPNAYAKWEASARFWLAELS
jgi:LysM repeat protein